MMKSHPKECPNCDAPLVAVRWTSTGMQFVCGACGTTVDSDFPNASAAAGAGPSPASSKEGPQAKARLLWDIPANAIILPLKSKNMLDAMDELVHRALHNSGKLCHKRHHIVKTLRETLRAGLAEYHDRVAIVHLNVDDLVESRVAMGIAPEGLESAHSPQMRAFVVLLCLLPIQFPGPLLSSDERSKFCDEKTVCKLRTATDTSAVIQVLKEGAT